MVRNFLGHLLMNHDASSGVANLINILEGCWTFQNPLVVLTADYLPRLAHTLTPLAPRATRQWICRCLICKTPTGIPDVADSTNACVLYDRPWNMWHSISDFLLTRQYGKRIGPECQLPVKHISYNAGLADIGRGAASAERKANDMRRGSSQINSPRAIAK
ncbi:hypothetical protein NA56DRAFT_699012 [Hyaloscypha hepaticicola]|uniref:Uncharacterized protein n=1 Tax=Hyaloscypha hepaticicola TaxID=2082293 RepID=A0A2J6QI47_9HELO|nr:hypothetical protein NA56DRAFT_699012 [Hyaloscypha hepaticicola]